MFAQTTRILIVDDMLSMRKIVIKSCQEIGFFNLVEASDGDVAWKKLNDSTLPPVGLILSDWNMPNLSGIDLLIKVRAEKKFAKLPFIMITAESERRDLIQAVKAGANDFLVKPLNTQVLAAKLASTYANLNSLPPAATRN